MHCDKCGQVIQPTENTPGYGVTQAGAKHCYSCCAIADRENMQATGKCTAYFCSATNVVTNWPGTLRFPLVHVRTSRHNMAGKRYDFWFSGPSEKGAAKPYATWHGYTIGDNTQIAHCKRTKG